MWRILRAAAICAAVWVAPAGASGVQDPATAYDSAATTQAAYAAAGCGACHGAALRGGFAAPLVGEAFRARWSGQPPEALLSYIRTRMPPARPGGLPVAAYQRITDHLLRENGLAGGAWPAAGPPRSPQAAAGGDLARAAGASGVFDDTVARAVRGRRAEVLAGVRGVPREALERPPAGDWIHFRRTYDGSGWSPLRSIRRDNVGRLTVAWTLSLPAGTNQIAPLVRDGVMFVHSSGVVLALDARQGDVLWSYARPVESQAKAGRASHPRGLAMHGTSLIVPTVDGHLISLDSRTGTVNWDHAIRGAEHLLLSAAPLVADGKVIQGVSGCDGSSYPGGCFIVALDAGTGVEVWRFHTLQRPGDGPDSWGGAPLEQRFGGSVWTTGSYDPDLRLVFFGGGQTYRIDPLMAARPGAGDALYTDSTVALDPETGALVWRYQHTQREIWDLDWAFERQLIDLPGPGAGRRALMTMGKMGILDVLDARTGQYLQSFDLGLQSLVQAIDPKTGAKSIPARYYPRPGVEVEVCPYAGGVRNWPATAYDPVQRTLYVPAVEACMTFSWTADAEWSGRYRMKPRSGSDGSYGRIQAIRPDQRSSVWTQRRRAPASSAILATAGGLVFEGDRDRWFRASDSATGKALWRMRLDAAPNAFPISFAAGGDQLIAVTTGGGGPLDAAWRELTPEIATPAPATTLWVFKLSPD